MTSRWAYRCGESGVSLERTEQILKAHSFCWRSVYKNADVTTSGQPPLIGNLKKIAVRDQIVIYYRDGDDLKLLGSYMIEPPAKVAATDVKAVGVAVDSALIDALSLDPGYPTDPFLLLYTGFFLRRDSYVVIPATPPRFTMDALRPLN